MFSSVNAAGFYGHPPYSAAKAALLSLTRSIAVQYAPKGIRCNAIVPGTIKTPAWAEQVAVNPETFEILRQWYPSGDVAEPEDIADIVLFLASAQGKAMNGASLVADSWLTAGNLAMSRFVEGVLGEA
ncbi:SDR family oxidoreductase [Renibacterium salmoninarum]|uniref:SDR family oxidoreductase n=1 Tax=Renibacterium salmoninarum TaxID=1646 RepID=UPI0009B5CE13|nr:SDR family oxidoreductase [Renibacterium salmoninarum]